MKIKSIRNKLLSGLLALALLISLVPARAFAFPKPAPNKPLVVQKTLTVAEGVKTPDETFTFTFEKHSYNGKKEPADLNMLPEIPAGTVQYKSTEDINIDGDKNAPGRQLTKLSNNVLGDVIFEKTGQYTYIVKETKGNNKDITYSDKAYIISIFVQPSDKPGNRIATSFQIASYSKDEAGEDVIGNKEEYTPQEGKGAFNFTNTYDKVVETTEATKTEGFVLKKEVAGENPDARSEFEFSMTVTKPEGIATGDTFTYYLSSSPEATETGIYGTAIELKLKHNEEIIFKKVSLGSKVAVEEIDSLGYTPSIKAATMNGDTVTIDDLKAGQIIGDNGPNSVEFLNTQQTPTGVIIDNLPFIALALMATAGIFFFIKNSRKEEVEA